MAEEKKEKKKFLKKLTDKFRLVLLNDSNFQEIGYLRLNRLNVISVSLLLTIIFIAVLWSLIAYTPIRELIPGYPNAEMRNNIIQSRIRLDSLELELNYRDNYFANLKSIISGERPEDFLSSPRSEKKMSRTINSSSINDSLPQKEGRYETQTASFLNLPPATVQLDKLHFFSPVRGIVTNSFNPMANHFGTDVVAGPNEVVKATLDGTIIIATWTLETGYIIQIQHNNNLISVYKHNAELLKKVGSKVKAGDAIAIIGNSGELTTGPHLHFEIWQNGVPLNPENLIVF